MIILYKLGKKRGVFLLRIFFKKSRCIFSLSYSNIFYIFVSKYLLELCIWNWIWRDTDFLIYTRHLVIPHRCSQLVDYCSIRMIYSWSNMKTQILLNGTVKSPLNSFARETGTLKFMAKASHLWGPKQTLKLHAQTIVRPVTGFRPTKLMASHLHRREKGKFEVWVGSTD